jgi:hypothetical protein
VARGLNFSSNPRALLEWTFAPPSAVIDWPCPRGKAAWAATRTGRRLEDRVAEPLRGRLQQHFTLGEEQRPGPTPVNRQGLAG